MRLQLTPRQLVQGKPEEDVKTFLAGQRCTVCHSASVVTDVGKVIPSMLLGGTRTIGCQAPRGCGGFQRGPTHRQQSITVFRCSKSAKQRSRVPTLIAEALTTTKQMQKTSILYPETVRSALPQYCLCS